MTDPMQKQTEHWIEVGTGQTVRMLRRLKPGAVIEGTVEFSTDGDNWFLTTIAAFKHGKAKDSLLYAGDTVDQGGIEAWLVGMVEQLKKLTPGTFLKVHCVGDMLLTTQEREVLEPIRMSEIKDLDLKTEESK